MTERLILFQYNIGSSPLRILTFRRPCHHNLIVEWQRHVSFRIIHLSNIGQLFERLTDIFDPIKNLYQNSWRIPARITKWIALEFIWNSFKNSSRIPLPSASLTKFLPEKLMNIKESIIDLHPLSYFSIIPVRILYVKQMAVEFFKKSHKSCRHCLLSKGRSKLERILFQRCKEIA